MTDSAGRDAWLARVVATLFSLALALALVLAVVWTTRGFAVFNYTEGVVLGSLAGLDASGLSGLYPSDWSSPPLVLTLYPPVFFWMSAAVDSALGAADPLTAPRLVTLAATLFLGWCLVRIRGLNGTSLTWFLVLVGAAVLTPAILRQLAAAQVDVLAAAWTVAGVLIVLRSEHLGTPMWPAFACFAVAAFTKQSFLAAPAALILFQFTTHRRRHAVLGAAGFAGILATGFLVLDHWTAGGFRLHTLAAVTDSGSFVNFARVMGDSAPYLWIPFVALVLLGVHDKLRPGFPELWVLLATLVHFAAMWKTGASVNYLVEPLVALLVLGIVRSTDAPWARERLPVTRHLALAVLALVAAGSSFRAIHVVQGTVQASRAARISMSAFEHGFPLVDVDFFPAVFERNGRPYVNDPFAFGALAESGTWDPSGLSADLESRRVPFAVTAMDLRPPLADGTRTEDVLFAYFWRMGAVRDGLLRGYAEVRQDALHLWVPREGGD